MKEPIQSFDKRWDVRSERTVASSKVNIFTDILENFGEVAECQGSYDSLGGAQRQGTGSGHRSPTGDAKKSRRRWMGNGAVQRGGRHTRAPCDTWLALSHQGFTSPGSSPLLWFYWLTYYGFPSLSLLVRGVSFDKESSQHFPPLQPGPINCSTLNRCHLLNI